MDRISRFAAELERAGLAGALVMHPVSVYYLAGTGQSIVRYEIPLPAGATEGNTHVRVQLFSQTLPPYFLADRSRTPTPATKRLEYLTGTLGTLSGTDYENWKLLVASAER